MKITIDKLVAKDFKGITYLCLDLNGSSAEIRGKNGCGKSSAADSFYWLISGKNIDLRADFNIMPLDKFGIVIDHMEPTVEADLDIDGKKLSLSKIYKQKWTKKRGSADKELTGHTTNHFIDSVPVSKREYDTHLSRIVDDTLLRILTDVRQFCTSTTMEFRRAMLLDIAGDISDDKILHDNEHLADLGPILAERTVDQHKKILAEKKKAVNRELKEIPVRINELKLSIVDTSEFDEKSLRKDINHIDDQIKSIQSEISSLENGLGIAEKRKQVAELEAEFIDFENYTKKKLKAEISEYETALTEYEDKLKTAIRDGKRLNDKLESIIDYKKTNASARSGMMKKWQAENDRVFEPTDMCFACGQSLPESKISEQSEAFNSEKAANLKDINERGKNLKQDFILLELEEGEINTAINENALTRKDIEADATLKRKQIHDINNKFSKEIAERQLEIMSQIESIKADIETFDDSFKPQKDFLNTSISKLDDDKSVLQARITEIVHAGKTEKRISALNVDLKTYSGQYEQIEKELWLIEAFEKARATYTEKSVAGYFKITQWRLFEMQMNQGVRNICEPCYNGIPYSSDLNTGAKINVGLDCIGAIGAHHDISAPIFVDNAESITDWYCIPNAQTIKLIAVEDKPLQTTKLIAEETADKMERDTNK